MHSRLMIRADANPSIGTGHVMRCLALAEAWKAERGPVTFISNCPSDALRTRICNTGCGLVEIRDSYPAPDDLRVTLDLARKSPDSPVVLDGYAFDSDYQRKLKETGNRLLVVDDYGHAEHYVADLILNQNLGAETLAYSREPYTRILCGPKYALLRAAFAPWKAWRREFPEPASRVLVTMGGSDLHNVTLRVIRALAGVDKPKLKIAVVVGAENPHMETLQEYARNLEPHIRLSQNLNNIEQLMAWADVAVSAGGTTCWELAFMGLPNIILILADNQVRVAGPLQETGVSHTLGRAENVDEDTLREAVISLLRDPSARRAMSQRGRSLVDGEGCRRVVEALTDSVSAS